MTANYWNKSDQGFQMDSEGLVVSMVTSGKYGFDISNKKFGLGVFITPATTNVYDVYYDSTLVKQEYQVSEYKAQIGLQGWIFYLLAKYMPYPLQIFRFGCCLAVSLVMVLISVQLFKRYGLLLASCFYIVSLYSAWITNFAPNLFWVEFTWFVPMLLGLICVNHLDKRAYLYPLFFLSIALKCACGYEYISVIMLSSILFLIVDWICVSKTDNRQRKILLRTIFTIGIISVLAFATIIVIHSWIQGEGNISEGLGEIFKRDVLRRTFGNAENYGKENTGALNASVIKVLAIYLYNGVKGAHVLILSFCSLLIIVYKMVRERYYNREDVLLFVLSFLCCTSWFVLGKAHSYIHIHVNYVMWYMGYVQINTYIIVKFILNLMYRFGIYQDLSLCIKTQIEEEIQH